MTICKQCATFTSDVLAQSFPLERWQANRNQPRSEHFTIYHFDHSKVSLMIEGSPGPACPLCRLLLKAAEDDVRAFDTTLAPDGLSCIRVMTNRPFEFYVEITVTNSSRIPYAAARFEMYNMGSSDGDYTKPNLTLIQRLPAKIYDTPDCDEAMQLARTWVDKCLQDHPRCIRSSKQLLPSRVLDVEPFGSSDIRLCQTLGKEGEYATLSHCWGGVRDGITTSINLVERMSGFALSSLPKTFRDTIQITRKLGIQYLWIDSLCILQDSKEDWMVNCPKMAQIYANSVVTIAALWAKGDHDGIILDRWHVHYKETFPPVSLSPSDWCSKLTTRGWVLQERILSPAVLYFAPSQMYWECRSCTASESHPKLVAHEGGSLKDFLSYTQREGIVSHSEGHFTAWYLIVEEYTYMNFTFQSDRYPAILGLANEFHRRYHTKHLAGLWLEDLERGLLWVRSPLDRPQRRDRPAQIERAPSWSWVSNTMRVFFGWCVAMPLFYYPIKRVSSPFDVDLVDATIRNGQMQKKKKLSGQCQMWGYLVPASYKNPSAWVGAPHEYERNRGYLRKRRGDDGCRLSCELDFDGPDLENVYCLRIATWEHELGIKQSVGGFRGVGPVYAYYLVLQHSGPVRSLRHELDRGKFHRIGVGAAEIPEVDAFFATSQRYFVTLV